jgi:GDPmannose 4,6-dehydratase
VEDVKSRQLGSLCGRYEEKHSVRDLASIAFDHVGLNWHDPVGVDEGLYRPVGATIFSGDATRIRTNLGWQPEIAFEELIRDMVDADLGQLWI